jgi:hypothetical protein
MAKHFYLNITDEEGILIDRLCIDGTDLSKRSDRDWLGERIQMAMGGDNVAACADLPEALED